MMKVKAWRESVVIPTYEVGKAEKNPIFLEKRVYQGSSGVVYPNPVIESIADEPVDKEWHAVWLENEYIKVMILPELGGRVQMAYDKIRQRHFVYYNNVIKPALVGLLGPWISGGIEFNWPQHHRPSTYMPVDCTIEENEDGSVTVWVSEMEKMFHQKGMAGFTLRPGCAYLEIKGQLYNRTDVPQTFLWWANPAVEVNDAYQSVFPQDINAVFDHGKRAVSSFPIATGTYYKMDYSSGVDISNYKNIFVPTSYMGVNSKFNFEGGYENDTQAGMLHVASNHFSPGKKQWTWGNGDFGRAWDRALTDPIEERWTPSPLIPQPKARGYRPYIELMAGVYTENQPDFTWLMPYEEKQFVQYFMPYSEVGLVKNANKDLVFNVDGTNLILYATNAQHIHLVMKSGDAVVHDAWHDVSPIEVLRLTVDSPIDSVVILKEQYGKERPVLTWQPEPDDIKPIPDAAEAALLPRDVKTTEQLYLTGLHLEQYRHATYVAADYYEEALRRDPDDLRCLNAMGLWYLRRGRFEKAEPYLRKAVKIIMKRNPNPYDGEPLYNLALCLKYMGQIDEAYHWFWKATWNKAWADAAYFEAAKISTSQGRLDDALEELRRCLISNAHNQKALALKASVLRLMGRLDEMQQVCEDALRTDPFNYGCLFELGQFERLQTLMHQCPNNYHELALDFLAAGLADEARTILLMSATQHAATPMTYYYLGDYAKAESASSDYCFPNRLDDILALEAAKKANPNGAKAYYYLGCLYYDKRQYDVAVENWKQSAQIDPDFPTVWRNLALAYFNKQHDVQQAVECMERAFQLDTTDARIYMELDQLYKRLGRSHAERLALMQQHLDMVETRDDLRLEYATLLNQNGRYSDAMHFIDAHRFHVWEGGEGKVPAQYQLARTELAKLALAKGENEQAIQLLNECLEYPWHLGEGKLYGAQENDIHYFLGCAYQAMGQHDKACQYWEQATQGPQEPAAAMYYNDAKPEKIFYQGLALLKLGREAEARSRFHRLVGYGKQHIFDNIVMDYFAVSLPDLQIWEGDLNLSNQIHCKFMLALGYYGLGDTTHALRYLSEVEALDINHLGIYALRTLISHNE
ncbi:MAG: DUF5107 domain-containing protein [Bacteroidales bacterium]|nr:DUF5107 domain-containing protein [Bacteroidales bacterium]